MQACGSVQDARSYTLLQAAAGLGKTSSLVLGMLTCMRTRSKSLQYILLALEACDDVEKYLRSLGCFCSVDVAYLKDAPEGNTDVEEDVASAASAQVIVGNPRRVCEVLHAAQGRIVLDSVDVLLMDDAASLIGDGWVQKVCEINQLVSIFARHPLRYVVVSNFIEREAKPALRALKSSLMNKKNMFDLSQQVGRIRNCVKHYLLLGKSEDWLSTLVRLREMIYIPRAVIFCDDDKRFEACKKALSKINYRDLGGSRMTVAINDAGSQTQKERRDSIQSFCKEQCDFLLTRSEPNIFQASLPRVFWIIHFGVEAKNLPWYGCRLLCLDSQLREKVGKNMSHEGVSMCFMEKDQDQAVPKLEKLFGIKFESLPFGEIS